MNECQDDLALAVELLCTLIQHDRIDDTDLQVLMSNLDFLYAGIQGIRNKD